MTPSSPSSPTGPWSGTDHPEVDLLADLAEGLTDPATTDTLGAHLDDCPECADTLAALAEVGELLGSMPSPELPAGVAERIDAALAAEAIAPTVRPAAPLILPAGRPGPPNPASTPTPASTRPRDGRPRRRRVPRRALIGTAVALLGIGLFGGLLRALPDPSAHDTTAASGAAGTHADAKATAATRFTEQELPAQVRRLVAGRGPAIAPGKGPGASAPAEQPGAGDGGDHPTVPSSPAPTPPAAPSPAPSSPAPSAGIASAGGTEEAGSPSCPGLPPGRPLAEAPGDYAGEQVTALVFPLGPDRYDTYLVAPGCRVLLHRTVPAG
ncbi:hypothetical protein ACIRBX_06420 [Kitasatospora sp. NPDC096147]|uniref:hypothetical protein n=1 Tax=Kitasatospora sp. NPDC096147 TaxID=3364093 RepID=UPI0037FB987B